MTTIHRLSTAYPPDKTYYKSPPMSENISGDCLYKCVKSINNRSLPREEVRSVYFFTGVLGKITQKAIATTNAKPAKIYQLVCQPCQIAIGPADTTASA